MRLDPIRDGAAAPAGLAEEIAAGAGAHDRDASFPQPAFAALRRRGLVGHPPLAAAGIGRLLRLLAEIGRGDLNVGRIFEGHVNALLLIRAYGTAAQRERFDGLARAGDLLGVWNTDAPEAPLRLEGDVLRGRKNFASGVDGLSHAIVTVPGPDGRLMLAVPLAERPVDRRWWRPLGMRASGSHVVDFEGLRIEPDWIVGRADDYLRPPWFFAGAIRFAAVHVGGMRAVLDASLAHLKAAGRLADPYQLHRLGRMGIAVEDGYNWLDRGAAAWRLAAADDAPPGSGDALIATVNAARIAVEDRAMTVLELAERSVGAAGLIAPHPLERLVRDLRTYLRQPNPDGALAAFGRAVADESWRPGRGGIDADREP